MPTVLRFIEPCLPSPADRPPSGSDWIHEIKHDSTRSWRSWKRSIRAGGADAVLRAAAYGRGGLLEGYVLNGHTRRRGSTTFPTRAAAAAERQKLQVKLDLAKTKVLRGAP